MTNGGNNKYPDDFLKNLFGSSNYKPTPPKPAPKPLSLPELLASLSTPSPKPLYKPQIPAPTTRLVKIASSNTIAASDAQRNLASELTTGVRNVLNTELQVIKTSSVPRRDDIGLNNGRLIESAVLYIDIRNSTTITESHRDDVAAKIYKAYLESMVYIARSRGGHIRGFAGDKIMVIFDNVTGGSGVGTALDCAVYMQSFIEKRLSPALNTAYNHPIACGIGIDYSKMVAVRGGIKNNNEIIWAGKAANRASKYSDNAAGGDIVISKTAKDQLNGDWLAQKKFNLAAARGTIALTGSKLGPYYTLARVRYDI